MTAILRKTALLALLLTASPALAGPDLVPEVIVTKGAVDGQGKVEVTYTLTIKNVGDATCPAGGYFVDFWPVYTCEGCAPAGGCGDNLVLEPGDVPALPPGGQPFVLVEKRSLEPNQLAYSYLVYVDSTFNMCKENDENNNILCDDYEIPITAGEADLKMAECTVELSTEDITRMAFTATVENVGNSATKGAVLVDFYLQSQGPTCDDHLHVDGDAFAAIPEGLEPGASVTVTAEIECPAATYTGACMVNAFEELDEPDYQNNCDFTDQYVCVEAKNNPDLVITSFQAQLQNGSPVYKGTVANLGTVDVEPDQPFKLGIWYNIPGGPDLNTCPDKAAGEGEIIAFNEGLASMTDQEFAVSAPPMENGYYEVWAVVDCDGEVFEMDEKNNEAADDLFIDEDGPDLVVKDAAVNLDEVDCDFSVHYTVWVENVGTEPVDGFDVDIFWDAEKAPSCFAPAEGKYVKFEEPLEPGAVRQVEAVWDSLEGEPVPSGSYTSWIVLDICGGVYEQKEDNNTYSLGVEVPVCIDGLPNLDITFFKAHGVVKTAHYDIEVSNTGVKACKKPFRIDLFTDQEKQPLMGDKGDFHVVVDKLEPGATLPWSVDWEDLEDGEYRAYVIVDTENVCEEAVEADNVVGPYYVNILSDADQCPEGKYVTKACLCGGETVNYGFCCEDAWYAVGCPDGTGVEPDMDVIEGDAAVVEFGNGNFQPADPGCGCRLSSRPSAGPSAALVALLVMALYFSLRRQRV
jgi:MYXO-CTERM domain-containing protein